MADPIKRWAAVAIAVSAVILGLDKGGIDVAPGPDLGLSCPSAAAGTLHALDLSADHGDIRCFLRLRLRRLSSAPRRLGARLSNGAPLQVWLRPSAASGALSLSIYQPGPAREKFLWPSGVHVQILDWDRALVGATIDDWSVFLSDNQHDSRSKARWRAAWLGLRWILVLVALAGGLVTTLKPDAHRPLTPETYVENLIESIEGGSAGETERLRTLLKRVVLEGAPAAEARDSLEGSAAERMQLWFKARRLFLGRLDHLIEKLSSYRADLS